MFESIIYFKNKMKLLVVFTVLLVSSNTYAKYRAVTLIVSQNIFKEFTEIFLIVSID